VEQPAPLISAATLIPAAPVAPSAMPIWLLSVLPARLPTQIARTVTTMTLRSVLPVIEASICPMLERAPNVMLPVNFVALRPPALNVLLDTPYQEIAPSRHVWPVKAHVPPATSPQKTAKHASQAIHSRQKDGSASRTPRSTSRSELTLIFRPL
jgi:hypothetical protein